MKVGIIGLGIMGGAFARNLLAGGFEVIGVDVAAENVAAIEAAGGAGAGSPREAALEADIMITSLPSAAAFHDVVSGDHGIAAALKDGLIVIEASTLPIADKEAGRDALAAVGSILLDCPISGTGSQAATKDLAVYASGDAQAYETAAAVFDGFARTHTHVGPFGAGSKMKYVANHLVHIHNVASAEAMVLGMKAGLDPKLMLDVLTRGAGTSRVLELRGPMMAEDKYDEATMKIDIWQKDMNVIGEFAASMNMPVPVFAACVPVYLSALAKGMDKLDTAAVCRVMEEMAGLDRGKQE